MEDAMIFFELYNKSDKPVTHIDLEEKLLLTGRSDFPFYYPNMREMELIVFDTDMLL